METFFLARVREEHYRQIEEMRQELLEGPGGFDGTCQLEDYPDIGLWHRNSRLFEDHDTCPPGYALSFQYLFLKNDILAGMICLRPEAMIHPFLKRFGGHIGYCVRPSMRRQGIGTAMLKAMLKEAKEAYGLERLMVCALEDNIASKKVIINNGGVHDSTIYYPPEQKNIERYFIRL